MGPKKKEAQKMTLGDFLNDSTYGGSWADEVEDTIGTQQLPATDRSHGGMGMGSSTFGGDRGYMRSSAPVPLPTRPPYTAHLGNLPYDATMDGITDFFDGCGVVSVRIIEDRELQRPKGFAYVEFSELDGLKRALELDSSMFNGRSIKVKVADAPRDRNDSTRDFGDWTRKGPLPDLPSRGGDRRQGDFGDRRQGDFGDRRQGDFGERRPPRESVDDGKVRDFGNWERKGPLSPLPNEAPPMSREGSRARTGDPMRNRHQSPAWGEGRQEGSRPPREARDKPERVPTAAERDTAWRNNMRPDPRAMSPSQSRDGSEAPPSPAAAPAAPAVRPKLNLAKRTVSEAPDPSTPATGADASKPNPFGGAKPIDTNSRERAIEERKQKEKQEAEEKAKEDRRLAKEAAAKEEAEKAEAAAKAAADATAIAEAAAKATAASTARAEAEGPADTTKPDEAARDLPRDGAKDQKPLHRTREPREPREPRDPKDRPDIKSRASESGNWRQTSGEHRAPRGAPSGPRRGRGRGHDGGGRHDGPRPPRANGSQQQPPTPATAEPGTPTQDEDGWTTVPKNARRGPGRPVAS